ELGLVQTTIPEAQGGYGDARSAVTGAVLLEELAYGDLALALHLLTPRLLAIPLVVAGTEEQRARWLPRFTGPDFSVATAAFIEPRWDFDPTALATRATRQGGDWVISGEKCLVRLARRFRPCPRLCQGPTRLRPGDRAKAGDRLHARRHGDRDRRHAAARLGGRVPARQGTAGDPRVLSGAAVCEPVLAQDHRQRRPG